MNHLLRTLISLAHLTKAKSKGGQIATLLLLLLVIMLIFVMVTVNLGNVAIDATKISNAADSAVLQLASNLVTKAKMLYDGLGGVLEKCQKRGFLAIVLAVIVAIIVTVASYGSLSCWVVGLIAAVFGAIGGAIAGTGWVQGAITGFAVGVAIGGIGAGLSGTAGSNAAGEAVTGAIADGASADAIAAAYLAVPQTAINIGAVAYGAMGVAATVYNASEQDKMVSETVSQLQKDLSKLNEYDRFRESAFFTALKQVVDDPNVHSDDDDLDADTNTTELIPRFAWWWHRRMVQFANARNAQVAPLNNFLADMRTFRDFAYQAYAGSGITDPVAGTVHSPGYLERADYKWTIEIIDNDGMEAAVTGAGIGVVDGLIVGLLRPLHNFGFDTKMADGSLIWEPGPTPAEMNTWLDEECNSIGGPACSPAPSSYDYLDLIADELRQMAGFMNGIVPPTFEKWVEMQYANVNSGGWGASGFWTQPWLASLQTQYNETMAVSDSFANWEGWRYFFYNPTTPSDPNTYYTQLQTYIDILTRLKNELINIRDSQLPACNEGNYDSSVPPLCNIAVIPCDTATCEGSCYGEWRWNMAHTEYYWYCVLNCGQCVMNPPCSFSDNPSCDNDAATIDTNSDDELGPAIAAIDDLIGRMGTFRTRIKDWSDEMDGYIADVTANGLGGIPGKPNAIEYRWTDMRGNSQVIVEAGPFQMPKIETEKRGNWLIGKTCSVLKHYWDEENCWIKVTRYPPTNVSLGALGRWNPFIRGVSKVSKAYYAVSPVKVGIKAKNL